MGLFDNIIGTATEWVEPLGMDTIVDDAIPPPVWWGSGKRDDEEEEEKEKVNPNVISWDAASSIILSNDTTTEVPNIDIGGDMFNFSFNPPPEQPSTTEAPPIVITDDANVAVDGTADGSMIHSITEISDITEGLPADTATPEPEVLSEAPITTVDSNVSPLIDLTGTPEVLPTDIATPEPEVVLETPIPETSSISPLIDLTGAPEVLPIDSEVALETPIPETSSISPLIDLTGAPEVIPTDTATPEPEVLSEAPIPETPSDSPIDNTSVTPDISSNNLETTPIESNDTVSAEGLANQINNRISTFVADLENIKATEKLLIHEKRNALAQITAEEQIIRANFTSEKLEIQEAVQKLEDHQVQIDQTIALIKNTKIV